MSQSLVIVWINIVCLWVKESRWRDTLGGLKEGEIKLSMDQKASDRALSVVYA